MLSTFWSGLRCLLPFGSVTPVVATPDNLGIVDKLGYTEMALTLTLSTVNVPVGEVLSVDVVLETDDDVGFASPVVVPGYVGNPIQKVIVDNTDGAAPITDDQCVLIPLKCAGDTDRFVRAVATLQSAPGGTATVGTLGFGYIGAGSPVNLANGPVVP